MVDGCPRPGQLHSVAAMNSTASHSSRQRPLGLPFAALLGLALLAAPRVLLHDLGVIDERSLVNLLLVVIPPVAWIVVAVWAKVPNPFLTLLVTGACYGVLLAGIHQLFWEQAFNGSPPALGGNFSSLDIGVRRTIPRIAAVFSSMFTGVAIGAITGLVAWAVTKVAGQRTKVG